MSIRVQLQYGAVERDAVPEAAHFRRWVTAALEGRRDSGEVVIRLVDEAESEQLNQTFRHKTGSTNVLSFPFHAPPPVVSELIGDLAICVPLARSEARQLAKDELAHWAHLVVHGVLHLLGFDHQNEADARRMEGLESELLSALGFPDPYRDT